jgi:hypothetical protein
MKEGEDVPLPGERPESAYFLSVNRNKRSMSVDFKTEKGLRILQRLVKQSDILVENFIPGEKLRLKPRYVCTDTGIKGNSAKSDWVMSSVVRSIRDSYMRPLPVSS